VLFFACSLAVDARRLLWYDEISTLALVRLPSIAALWHAMYRPIDASTPTYFVIERLFDHMLHPSALSARLLSSIAVATGLLVVFHCTSRLVGGLYGLIAVGVLTCSFLPYYSYEARAYGLDFLISAAALWVWLHIQQRDWVYAGLFGLCFFLGELTHYYFVLSLVPYVCYELLRGWSRRHIKALAAAVIGVICAGVILLPAALAIRALSKTFWARISYSNINAFSHFFPYGMVPLAGVAIALALLSFLPSSSEARPKIARPEPAEQLGWLFLLIPIAGIVVGRLVTHAFVDRYFIGFLPGVAIGAACFCSRVMKGMYLASAVAASVLLGFGLGQHFTMALHPEMVDPYHEQQTKTLSALWLEPRILQDGKRFIVVENPLLFLETHYYSPHPSMYPYMPALNMAAANNTEAITLANMGQLGWFQLWTVDQLIAHANDTALIDPAEGLVRQLRRRGYKLTVKALYPLPAFYIEKL
jgi:hypothetical protein